MDIILLWYIVLIALIHLPPSFLLKYNLSVSLLGWELPVIARVLLGLISILSISLQTQCNIPTVDVKLGTGNVLWVIVLLKSDIWEFQIFLIRLTYFLVTFCFVYRTIIWDVLIVKLICEQLSPSSIGLMVKSLMQISSRFCIIFPFSIRR